MKYLVDVDCKNSDQWNWKLASYGLIVLPPDATADLLGKHFSKEDVDLVKDFMSGRKIKLKAGKAFVLDLRSKARLAILIADVTWQAFEILTHVRKTLQNLLEPLSEQDHWDVIASVDPALPKIWHCLLACSDRLSVSKIY
jgi:hypothetical protein